MLMNFISLEIRNRWWFDLMLGFVVLSMGLFCFTRPDQAVLVLGRVFGLFLLFFGVLRVAGALTMAVSEPRLRLSGVLEGVLNLVLALVLLLNPAGLLVFARVLGLFALISGVFRFLSTALTRQTPGVPVVAGGFSILGGLLLLVYPQVVAGVLTAFIGILLILAGMLMLASGISQWKFNRRFF